jgi:hypothetical protein
LDSTSDVLDGGMVTLAIFTLNIFHPGFLFKKFYADQEKEGSDSGVV